MLSNITERIIYNQLTDFFNKYMMLSDCQKGFRLVGSTESASCDFYFENVYSCIDRHKYVVSHFFVLYRTFDYNGNGFALEKFKVWVYWEICLTNSSIMQENMCQNRQ